MEQVTGTPPVTSVAGSDAPSAGAGDVLTRPRARGEPRRRHAIEVSTTERRRS
jgi:hypothetical protein